MDMIETYAREAASSAAISSAASKATIIGGAGTSVYSILGGDVLLTLVGIVCTIGTFILNWYYKRREYKLNERKLEMEYEMRMLAEQRRQMVADAQISAMQTGKMPIQSPDTTRGAPL